MAWKDFAGMLNKLPPLFLLFICANTLAQKPDLPKAKGSLIGFVADSASGEKIGYATLTLLGDSDSRVLNGTLTNAKGAFKLNGLSNGIYKLKVECIGYQAKLIPAIQISDKNQSVVLGTILISKSTTVLQEVTVTAKTPLVENKIDRIVYNVEKDITSQGGVATDVLRKVPEVAIDVDGNVELQGSGNIRFLIQRKTIHHVWEQYCRCLAGHSSQPDKKH